MSLIDIPTPRTSSANNGWRCVCYAESIPLLVAVSDTGTGNRVMTSPDGITWTSRTSAADNNWQSVCWNGSIFVAVASSGTGNRVMTSPDGITWTSRTSAANNNWKSVCWSSGLTLFVAVSDTGTGNRVMTSPDGITWTSRTSAANNNWQSVCWSPDQGSFVAVASSGTGNRDMMSTDGITWTSGSALPDSDWQSVCFSPEQNMFVAVANSGTPGVASTTYGNGLDWAATASNLPATTWKSVCWCPQISCFYIVSEYDGGSSASSFAFGFKDNANIDTVWTYPGGTDSSHDWKSVVWMPNKLRLAMVGILGTGDRVSTVNVEYLDFTLTETFAATDFIFYATDAYLTTGGGGPLALINLEVLSSAKNSGSSVRLYFIKNHGTAYVTAVADQGRVWNSPISGGIEYFPGEKVHPSNSVSTPRYYECITFHFVPPGDPEPVWPTSGTVDGNWSTVETLIQPLVHGPLTPGHSL